MLYPDMRKSNNTQSQRVCRSSLDDIGMVDQTTRFPEVPAAVISSRTAEAGLTARRRGRLLYSGISMSAFRRLSTRSRLAGTRRFARSAPAFAQHDPDRRGRAWDPQRPSTVPPGGIYYYERSSYANPDRQLGASKSTPTKHARRHGSVSPK
jgi:hypothetical protein